MEGVYEQVTGNKEQNRAEFEKRISKSTSRSNPIEAAHYHRKLDILDEDIELQKHIQIYVDESKEPGWTAILPNSGIL